jgi:hypothetical protein
MVNDGVRVAFHTHSVTHSQRGTHSEHGREEDNQRRGARRALARHEAVACLRDGQEGGRLRHTSGLVRHPDSESPPLRSGWRSWNAQRDSGPRDSPRKSVRFGIFSPSCQTALVSSGPMLRGTLSRAARRSVLVVTIVMRSRSRIAFFENTTRVGPLRKTRQRTGRIHLR